MPVLTNNQQLTTNNGVQVLHRRRPSRITAGQRIGVFIELEDDIDPGPGYQLSRTFYKIPGFELDCPSTLPHREAHVLFLHPDRLAADFDVPCDQQRPRVSRAEGLKEDRFDGGLFSDLIQRDGGVAIAKRSIYLRQTYSMLARTARPGLATPGIFSV